MLSATHFWIILFHDSYNLLVIKYFLQTVIENNRDLLYVIICARPRLQLRNVTLQVSSVSTSLFNNGRVLPTS